MKEKNNMLLIYAATLMVILLISILCDIFIINDKPLSLIDRFSYYGTIFTGFSLIITFLEVWQTKTIQSEIQNAIKGINKQKSLQHNPIIQKHLVKLRYCLYNNKFKLAKIEIDVVKNLILHHSEYKEIQELIKKNTSDSESKDGFFETLENALMKSDISAPEDIVKRNLDEFKKHQDYFIKILTKIEAHLNQHTGEQQ